MKKEEFIALGVAEELAEKCASASGEELKGYIPKSRFDEINSEKTNLKEALSERDKQLEDLKKNSKGSEELQKQIEELQTANKAKQAEYEAELNRIKIDSALDKAIISAKGKNTKAIKALIDMEGLSLDDKGELKGLDDQIKSLKEAEDSKFLFAGENAPSTKTAGPESASGDGGSSSATTLGSAIANALKLGE